VAAPRRLRLRPLGRQSAWLDGLRVDIDAAELTAEMLLRGLPPAPVAVTLHGAGLVLAVVPPLPAEDGTGWHLRLADVAGEMGLTGTAPILRLRADGITPGMSVWPAGTGPRPEGPLRLTLEAAAGFDQPVETGGRLTALRLDGLRLDWGASALAADGRLEVGADGVPQGRILVRAEGWRPLLGLAVASGWLDPGLSPTWLRVLETLQAAGSETARAADALELPVIFARGRVSLGPLPLGRAPLLAPPLPPGG
jgi:hypothetical protein